jgi:hypothetical protein
MSRLSSARARRGRWSLLLGQTQEKHVKRAGHAQWVLGGGLQACTDRNSKAATVASVVVNFYVDGRAVPERTTAIVKQTERRFPK